METQTLKQIKNAKFWSTANKIQLIWLEILLREDKAASASSVFWRDHRAMFLFPHSKKQGSVSLYTRKITKRRYCNIRGLFVFLNCIFTVLFLSNFTAIRTEISQRPAYYNCLTGIVISKSWKFKEPWTPTLIKDKRMLLYIWFKFLILIKQMHSFVNCVMVFLNKKASSRRN